MLVSTLNCVYVHSIYIKPVFPPVYNSQDSVYVRVYISDVHCIVSEQGRGVCREYPLSLHLCESCSRCACVFM